LQLNGHVTVLDVRASFVSSVLIAATNADATFEVQVDLGRWVRIDAS
jgi:hypothetical protein